MIQAKILVWLRRALATLVGGAMLLYFLDFTGALPQQMHALMHTQLVPALLGGWWIVLFALLALTLLFGRIYCSVLCPLGILQDVILRCKRGWLRLSGKGKRIKTRYARPLNILRYSVLGATALTFVMGSSLLLTVLDPYSNFGRIVTGLFRPAVIWMNNLLSGLLVRMDVYWLYMARVPETNWLVTGSAAVVLATLLAMVWRRERIWCNTVCPVGTLLGLFSRFSLFRIRIDAAACGHCRKCTTSCKARCIDDERLHIDASRCVVCFNCLEACKKQALVYMRKGTADANPVVRNTPVVAFPATSPVTQAESRVSGKVPDPSRRRFIAGSVGALVAAPLTGWTIPADDLGTTVRKRHPLPPGALSREYFVQHCTACQLCVSKCPRHVLRPAYFENGLTGIMQPYMAFSPEVYCNYTCTICTDVCPNHALMPLSEQEKKTTQVGIVHFVREKCVVATNGTSCGACAEHCPTGAVHMIPYRDGLTIPKTEIEYCIGCGGCESICPERPHAIFIEGLDEQGTAKLPQVEKSEEVIVDDFGF